MTNIITILKQRRVWAAICAVISLCFRAFAPDLDFDANKATDAILAVINAISDLGMIFLPLWSYFKPKNN